jgi:hypothetical protein
MVEGRLSLNQSFIASRLYNSTVIIQPLEALPKLVNSNDNAISDMNRKSQVAVILLLKCQTTKSISNSST